MKLKTLWVILQKFVLPKSLRKSLPIIVFFFPVLAVYGESELFVDYQHTHQLIDNFGASDAWTVDPMIRKWQEEGRQADIEKLADLLFSIDKGIGLSAWRFNIGAGSKEQGELSAIKLDPYGKDYRRVELMQAKPNAPIDTTKQLGQIRLLQEAVKRGVTDLIAFSNSPPVWATLNGLAHPDENIQSTNLDLKKTQEFAQFLVDVLIYLRNEKHIPINYISPINEPTWEWERRTQEGNRYNIEELKMVYHQLFEALTSAKLNHEIAIEAGEVVEYTAALSDEFYQKFSSNGSYSGGMNTRDFGLYRNYINELLGDITLRDKIDNKISLHGYFSDHTTARMGLLRDLVWQNIQEVSPNAKVWMSEVCILGGIGDVRTFFGNKFDVNDIQLGLHVGKMIHRDLTRMNASAWHWWLGITPYDYKDGLLKVNTELEASSLQTSKVFWILGQYSRFIRPGYQRINLTDIDNLNELMASAYKSPDDDKVIIVVVNSSDSEQSIYPKIIGLPTGKTVNSYQVYQTNQEDNLTKKTDYVVSKHFVVPAKSVVTFVGNLIPKEPSLINDYSNNGSDQRVITKPITASGAVIELKIFIFILCGLFFRLLQTKLFYKLINIKD